MDSSFLKKWQELATVHEQPWLNTKGLLCYPVQAAFEAMYNEDQGISTETIALTTLLTLRWSERKPSVCVSLK